MSPTRSRGPSESGPGFPTSRQRLGEATGERRQDKGLQEAARFPSSKTPRSTGRASWGQKQPQARRGETYCSNLSACLISRATHSEASPLILRSHRTFRVNQHTPAERSTRRWILPLPFCFMFRWILGWGLNLQAILLEAIPSSPNKSQDPNNPSTKRTKYCHPSAKYLPNPPSSSVI